MRAEEIREMSSQDIQSRVRELEEEQFRLRFRSATEPLEDPLRLRGLRKDIARFKTVLREKQGVGDAGSVALTQQAAAKAPAKRARKATPAKKAATKKSASAKKKTTRASR
jgi:large subunit ribosomal protein L29